MESYDKYIVAFSGGKDSTVCFLHLLDLGIPKEKIELWHCLIDGKGPVYMDWEVTEDYCRKFAEAFGVKIYFAWKEGGFKKEMYRENALTAPTTFEIPEGGTKTIGGVRGKLTTRRKFPQVSPDLNVRWCSAYLKIDVCSAAIRNQSRFDGLKTIVISGERGEESAARAKYAEFEVDRADGRNGRGKRHVDRGRLIKDWTEAQVWDIISKYKVVVHPCYYMGWSRCSCKFCIFGNADQFKSAYTVSPTQGELLISAEEEFGVTMKRKGSIRDLVSAGNDYPGISSSTIELATNHIYTGQIFTQQWNLPMGAFGNGCGPS